MIESLLLSLGLTVIFELGFALLFGLRRKKDILLVFLVNIVTNPPLVLTLNLLSCFKGMWVGFPLILSLELLVVLIEWLIYQKRLEFSTFSPLLLSVLLNTISYTGGLLLS